MLTPPGCHGYKARRLQGIGQHLLDKAAAVLLLPVSSVMVLVQGLESHPTVGTDNNSAIRLRPSNCEFAGSTFGCFPLQATVLKHVIPTHAPEFLEYLDNFL
jgi:hypothetical protein